MKRKLLIFLALLMLFGQWASTDHVYHEHLTGGSCEECIATQPFDQALTNNSQIILNWLPVISLSFTTDSFHSSDTRLPYHSRAPPVNT